MKTTVEYYIKGQPKQYKSFGTYQEARAFIQALAFNPDCECYGIVR